MASLPEETSALGVTSPRLIFSESDINLASPLVPWQISRIWSVLKRMDARDWVLAAASAWLVKWLVLRPYKMRIAGTVIFVNGATTTLGAELCRAAWREGASLFMVSKNKAALHELHRELSKTGQHTRLHTFHLQPGASFAEAARVCSDVLRAPEVVLSCDDGDVSLLNALQDVSLRAQASHDLQQAQGPGPERYAAGSSMQLYATFLPDMRAKDSGTLLAVQPAVTSGRGGGAWRESLRWLLRSTAHHLLDTSNLLGVGALCQEVVVPPRLLQQPSSLPRPSAPNGREQDAAELVLASLCTRTPLALHSSLNVLRSPSAFLSPLLKALGIHRVLCLGLIIEVEEEEDQQQQQPSSLSAPSTPRQADADLHQAGGDNAARDWILHGSPSKTADASTLNNNNSSSSTTAAATNANNNDPLTADPVFVPSPRDPSQPPSHPSPAPGPGSSGPWRTANPSPVIKAGLGIMLSEEHNGLQIVVIEKGSPAEKSADVSRGDVVVAVDGTRVAGKSSAEVLDMMQGAPGSTVTITVKSSGPGQVERKVELRRGAAKDSAWINKEEQDAGSRRSKTRR